MRSILQKSNSFADRYSFILFAAVFILFESILILRADWNGDFWEHAAVVRELSAYPFHPSHPLLGNDLPHQYISPYTFIVGIFSGLTGLNAEISLTIFAFVNLILFISCYYLFCKTIFRNEPNRVATLGLIFILLFWGKDPIGWSGFYHIFIFHHILPYPSTFAMSLCMLILSLVGKKPKFSYKLLPLLIILTAIIFIAHPTTGMILCCALSACILCLSQSFTTAVYRSAIILVPGFIIAVCWPYYDLIFLLTYTKHSYFHEHSKHLYYAIIQKNWPLVLVIPGLYWLRKDRVFQFLLLTMIAAGILYFAAYIPGKYGAGRLIAGIMFFGQIAIAYILVEVSRLQLRFNRQYILVAILFFAISLYRNGTYFENLVNKPLEKEYPRFEFLQKEIQLNDLVLSDSASNWIIPAYNGKVISSVHPLYWVKDEFTRKDDVKNFFIQSSTDSSRLAILDRYHPDYILVNWKKVNLSSQTMAWLEQIKGRVIYRGDSLEMIRLN